MHPEQRKALQRMSPEEKLQPALSLYHTARKLKEAGLRRQHPDWSEAKIKQKVREIFLYAHT